MAVEQIHYIAMLGIAGLIGAGVWYILSGRDSAIVKGVDMASKKVKNYVQDDDEQTQQGIEKVESKNYVRYRNMFEKNGQKMYNATITVSNRRGEIDKVVLKDEEKNVWVVDAKEYVFKVADDFLQQIVENGGYVKSFRIVSKYHDNAKLQILRGENESLKKDIIKVNDSLGERMKSIAKAEREFSSLRHSGNSNPFGIDPLLSGRNMPLRGGVSREYDLGEHEDEIPDYDE